MEKKRINLWREGEYTYQFAFSFQPNLVTYLHNDGRKHPAILVVPGGGYHSVSPTESETVALKFYNFGYNTFVLTYTVNLLDVEPIGKQPLKDISRAIRILRFRAEELRIDADKISVCGFSAGGHLCASLCVHYEDVLDSTYRHVSNRPDSAILCYPVITAREYAHKGSISALVGANPTDAELDYFDLTKYVTENTPPCFLWHTCTDTCVPMENSMLFAAACKNKGVPVALHLFSKGGHGLSTADKAFLQEGYKVDYPLEQLRCTWLHLQQDTSLHYELTPHQEWLAKSSVEEREFAYLSNPQENVQVAVWPKLAADWLDSL